MSFILDALKKSEDARLRQAGPSLADAPIRRRGGERPWWAIAVAALLLVNMVVLGIVLARSKTEPKNVAGASVAQPTPQASMSAPAPVVQSARPALESPGEPVPQMQPITGPNVAPAIITAPEPTTSAPQPTVISQPPAAAAPVAQAAPPPVQAQPQPSQENLPTANEVASRGAVQPLHLDLHVYAAAPAGRFVFINNRKYQEGQTIAEGAIVEEITPDGVILSSNGQRFMLPRQ